MSVPDELVTTPIAAQDYDPAVENPERYAIEKIRDQIHMQAADQESLLGTTADAAQLLLYSFAELVEGISTATDLDAVKASAAALSAQFAGFKSRVDAGTAKMPYRLYPLEDVFSEIETRATAVHDVLAAVAAQQSS